MKIKVAVCSECPFNYDTLECRARPESAQQYSPDEHADGSDCNQFAGRPDWCPLDKGVVTVEAQR